MKILDSRFMIMTSLMLVTGLGVITSFNMPATGNEMNAFGVLEDTTKKDTSALALFGPKADTADTSATSNKLFAFGDTTDKDTTKFFAYLCDTTDKKLAFLGDTADKKDTVKFFAYLCDTADKKIAFLGDTADKKDTVKMNLLFLAFGDTADKKDTTKLSAFGRSLYSLLGDTTVSDSAYIHQLLASL